MVAVAETVCLSFHHLIPREKWAFFPGQRVAVGVATPLAAHTPFGTLNTHSAQILEQRRGEEWQKQRQAGRQTLFLRLLTEGA